MLAQMYPGAFGRPTAKTGGLPAFGQAIKTGSGYALGTSQSTPPPPGAAPMPGPVSQAPNPYASQMGMQSSGTPTSGMPSAPAQQAPQTQGGLGGVIGGFAQAHQAPDPFGYLNPQNRQYIDQYFNSLAGQDYKGSHESALMRRAQLAQLLLMQQMQPEVDISGLGAIGRQYEGLRNRQAAMDAAMGRSGGGIGAAGQDALYGSQGLASGDYLRKQYGEREQRNHQDLADFLNWSRGLDAMGLGKNIDEQNSGGFFDQLLGVAGSLIPGIHIGGGK